MKYSEVKITPQAKHMKKIKGLYFTVTNYKYSPGKVSFKDSMSEEQYRDFMLYVAAHLISEIDRAIENQRYTRKWKPLNLQYYTYKKKHHLSLKIWEATGHMRKSMRVFKQGDYLAIGFDKRTIYPKSKIQVNLIARFLEFGSRDNTHPPSRPLWRPIHMYVRKNISRIYKSYLKELQLKHKDYLFF